MFENPIASGQNIPKASQEQPKVDLAEDIFAKTDQSKKNATISPAKIEEIEKEIFSSPKSSRKKLKWIIFILIFILLVGLAYLVFTDQLSILSIKFIKTAPVLPVSPATNNQPIVNNPAVQNEAIVDSDKDGISDAEEKTLGTDPYNPDSDLDGLSDLAEVKIYGTNPLNADTDGDGYNDGQEVNSGYNPKDKTPGAKLQDLQKELEKIKQ